jgi:hypothetical protein
LFQQTSYQVVDLLLALPPEVAVDVRHASGWIVGKPCSEVVNNDGCEDCLSSAGNAWAKQRLLTL